MSAQTVRGVVPTHRARNARRRYANVVFAIVMLGFAALWAVTLRPQSLGGPAGYVLVRGTSMAPTYRSGDLVLVRAASSYAEGDIVAYRIPETDIGEGVILIHRIIGGSGSEGFDLQGDNNPSADGWHPRDADIVGKAWLVLPRVGAVLGWARDPLMLASLAAGLAAATIMRPSRKDPPDVDVT